MLRFVIFTVLATLLSAQRVPSTTYDSGRKVKLKGTVTRIDLRDTALEHSDNLILIPTASLFTNAITVTRHPPTPADHMHPGTDGTGAARQTGQQRTVTS